MEALDGNPATRDFYQSHISPSSPKPAISCVLASLGSCRVGRVESKDSLSSDLVAKEQLASPTLNPGNDSLAWMPLSRSR